MKDDEDSSWAFAIYVFGGVKCRTQPMTVDSVNKSKEVRPPKKPKEQEENKSSKVESMYWRVFTSQVLSSLFTFCTILGLPLNKQCTISDNCSTCLTHLHNTHRHTSTWHGVSMHVYS